MTGEELYQMANDIAQDTIPETLFYQLLNVARNKREDSRPWQMLMAVDSTKTASVGDTYATSKALPTAFRRDVKLMVGTDFEYLPVPFMEQHLYRNASMRYFIDLANSVYYLTGSVNAAQTIYMYYLKTTTDFTSANASTAGICVWPERFQPIMAFDVAAMYQGGVDFDDVSARMSPFNRAMAKELNDAMIDWDNQLKLRSMNNSRLPTSNEEPTTLSRGGVKNLGIM